MANSNVSNPEYVTIMDLQDILCVSRKTAYKIAASGAIPIYRISPRKTLLKRSDVDRYVKSHRQR
ncbi:MAG: helix-turn-helix domain-containing protein [Clostridiales bacterium]|nr:helix-turn-helix domain-containing protein [Clostridiales bacterium]